MLAKPKLEWKNGVGWLDPINPIAYDRDYFAEYDRRSRTEIGNKLTAARLALVEKYYLGDSFCDVGIGSGTFVEKRTASGRLTYGWDINPLALDWLINRKVLRDPHHNFIVAASFWDVIEHISDYATILKNVTKWLFLSLPIFRDADHVLRSKHFKPGEHCWYFTRYGLIEAMDSCGFKLIENNAMETELGREDIESFVFRK